MRCLEVPGSLLSFSLCGEEVSVLPPLSGLGGTENPWGSHLCSGPFWDSNAVLCLSPNACTQRPLFLVSGESLSLLSMCLISTIPFPNLLFLSRQQGLCHSTWANRILSRVCGHTGCPGVSRWSSPKHHGPFAERSCYCKWLSLQCHHWH